MITGASSGIGRAAALLLDREGFSVYAGVRRMEDGDALAADASAALQPVVLDVTDAASIAAACARVTSLLNGRPLHGIVNNAGTTVTMPLEFADMDAFRAQFEVNTFGAVEVTKTFLPLLARPGGRIVNVSSGAGRIVTPLLGTYSASKYALVAVSDALRVELRGQGLFVSIIEPGFIDTPIHPKNEAQVESMLQRMPAEGRARYGPAIDKLRAANKRMAKGASPPEDVARAIERALSSRRPRARYPVTFEARLLQWIGPFLSSGLRDAIFGRIVGL